MEHPKSQSFNHITSIKSSIFFDLLHNHSSLETWCRFATIIQKLLYLQKRKLLIQLIPVANTFRGFRGEGFPADSWHSSGNIYCAPLLAYIFSNILESQFSTRRKQFAPQLNFTYRTLMTNSPLITWLWQSPRTDEFRPTWEETHGGE